jgi:LysM repeat protein
MAEGGKEAPIRSIRSRAGIAVGAIAAGILAPAGSALADPAADVLPRNLSPEEEAQQIAEMGDPPPDANPADDQPPADSEETPAGVPGSPDEELAQEPDDDATPAPAQPQPPAPADMPVMPQRLPAPSPPAPPPQGAAPPQGLAGTGPGSSNGAKPRRGEGGERRNPIKRPPVGRSPVQATPHAESNRQEPAPPTGPPADGKAHVVQAGESLWSIAAQLLGSHATPARIAALVDELWRLNADRIGSGDPTMIHPGDELVVP